MLKQRIIGSVVVFGLTVICLVLGGEFLFFGLLAISLIGMMELYRTLELQKTVLAGIGYLACILYYVFMYFSIDNYLLLFIVLLLLILTAYVISFPKHSIEQVSYIFIGLFYVAIMLSYIYKVRILDDGIYLVWLIFIGAWGSDTFAYLVGKLIGKRKFLPKLSPKKTLEGCFGGLAGATIIGFLYGLIFTEYFTAISNPKLLFALICGTSSIISQLGDLAASAIKRNHDIKDYGKLIPGHGGILDRFDSVIFVAPVVYYIITLVG